MQYKNKKGETVEARPTTATLGKYEDVESVYGACKIPFGTWVVTDSKGRNTFPSDAAFKELYSATNTPKVNAAAVRESVS